MERASGARAAASGGGREGAARSLPRRASWPLSRAHFREAFTADARDLRSGNREPRRLSNFSRSHFFAFGRARIGARRGAQFGTLDARNRRASFSSDGARRIGAERAP